MIRTLAICAALVFAASSAPAQAQARGNSRLASVIAAYEQYRAALRSADVELGRRSRGAAAAAGCVARGGAGAARRAGGAAGAGWSACRRGGCNGEDALNRAYLLRMIDDAIEGIDLDFGRAPIYNGDGFFTLGDYLAYNTPIQSAADAEAWIARLEALPDYYRQSMINARRGIETGYTQPRIVVDRAHRHGARRRWTRWKAR